MRAASHPSQAQRLETLYKYNILDTEREKEFDDIVNLASRICEAPISVVNLIDADRQWFKAETGLGVRETPLETSICSHVILSEEFVEIPDTLLDPRMADNPLCTGEPFFRFYAGAQLLAPNGLPLGTLCVLDNKPRVLTDLQRETLRVLSLQIMRELELRHSLGLQDTLRREMDHRVKNSLQTIASFIRLIRKNTSMEDPADAFDAIERRVRAISALHEELHDAGIEQHIQLDRFLRRICSQLSAGLPTNIDLQVNADEVLSGSAVSTTVGIVVSEFVANSVKHAFPDDQVGSIKVSLKYSDEGDLILACNDNGIGSRAVSSGETRVERLGSRLKEAAVSQIAGQLTRNIDENGYALEILIPKDRIST